MLFGIYKQFKSKKNLINHADKKAYDVRKLCAFIFSHYFRSLYIILKTKFFNIGSRAFTLIELMIVIAIIAVLATIAMPHYKKYVERTNRTVVIQTIRMLEKEITLFQLSNNRYPDNLDELGLGTLEDPWGNPFKYLNIADAGGKFPGTDKPRMDHSLHPVNTDYDLYSMGPDGKTNIPFTAKASRDDFVRANNGSFLGTVTEY